MVAICEALCAGGLKTSLVKLKISIYIDRMGYGEESIEAVGKFLKVGEKLEMVNLGENSISEKAAQYFSEGIQQNKSRKLKHLNLEVEAEENQSLSDEKAKMIMHAINNHLGIGKIILGIYSLVFWIYIYIYI